jgi:hypothetical protein
MEYIAQDVARSNEDMACSDKLLNDFEARIASFDPGNGTVHLTVSNSTIKMPRSFAERSDYHPISDRLLCDRSHTD